jgi:hypothetical protein
MATNNLRSRVARLEGAASDDDFLAVIIRNFTINRPPHARIGGHGGAEISQRAFESLDEFERRAINAAKAAGDRFVAIEIHKPLENVA